MSHLTCALGADPLAHELIVAPHGAINEQAVRLFHIGLEMRFDLPKTWSVKQIFTALGILDADADVVPGVGILPMRRVRGRLACQRYGGEKQPPGLGGRKRFTMFYRGRGSF